MTPEPGRIFRRQDDPEPQIEAADPVAAWAADFRARARGEKPTTADEKENE